MKKNPVVTVVGRVLKQRAGLALLTLAVVLSGVLSALLPPLALARVIDRLADSRGTLFADALLYFGLLALVGLLDSGREVLLVKLGQNISLGLRQAMSRKMTRLPAALLYEADPGAMTARFVGDVDLIETLFSSGLVSMAADALKIIGILFVIFTRNPGLGLVMCLVLPLAWLFTRRVQKKMKDSHLNNRSAVSRVSAHLPETIRNIRMIHNTGCEDYMAGKYDRYIRESYAAVEKTNFYDSIYSPVILISNAVVVAAVMLLAASGNAGILKLFGMSVGTSVAIISYITQIFEPLESFGMELQTVQSAVAGIARINDYLSRPEREEGDSDFTPADGAPCIRADRVTFRYPASPGAEEESPLILHDFSLTLEEGESVTLMGRTGAGKSTLFKLLLGLYEPQAGRIELYGRRAAAVPDREKRQLLGWVEQSFRPVPGTVLNQITLGDSRITREMALKAADLAGIRETIEKAEGGFDAPFDPENFSQGQKQLLTIARGIAGEPKILLLDEITANLDSETEADVLRALENACQNRTVLNISHRASAAMKGNRRVTLN